MPEKVKKTRKQNKSEGYPYSKDRRNFVKNTTAALPMALTLKSGAGFAMNSATQCINQDAQKVASPVISSYEDEWLRREIDCRLLKPKAKFSDDFWVYKLPDDSGAWLDEDGKHFYASNQDSDSDVDSDDDSSNDSDDDSSNDSDDDDSKDDDGNDSMKDKYGNSFKILDSSTCYILAIVDDYGNIVEYQVDQDGTGNHITGSCWTSIMNL